MFGLLGLHPGPDITVPAAAALAAISPSRARRALAELVDAHLITEHAPARFAMHDLLRAYAAEHAPTCDAGDRRAAIQRMLDHYLCTAHTAASLLNPGGEPIALTPSSPCAAAEKLAGHQEARAWSEAEQQVLIGAAGLADQAGFDVHAWQIPWAMADFLDWRGQWHEQNAIQRTALAAASRLGDETGQTVTRRLLARNSARLGDYDHSRALLAECLTLYRQIGDRTGEGRVHQSLSWVAASQERFTEALSHNDQALALFQKFADRTGQAQARNAIGWYHALLGDYHAARRFCRRALTLFLELGNGYGEANTWGSLGYAAHHLGDHAEAIACYRRAFKLYGELGNYGNEALVLTHLAYTYDAVGDTQRARKARQRALEILDELHHPDADQVRAELTVLALWRSPKSEKMQLPEEPYVEALAATCATTTKISPRLPYPPDAAHRWPDHLLKREDRHVRGWCSKFLARSRQCAH